MWLKTPKRNALLAPLAPIIDGEPQDRAFLSALARGRSAPAAELPIVDLDVEAPVRSSQTAPQDAVNALSRRRLERQRDSGWRCLVDCEQLTVDDQALARQSQKVR